MVQRDTGQSRTVYSSGDGLRARDCESSSSNHPHELRSLCSPKRDRLSLSDFGFGFILEELEGASASEESSVESITSSLPARKLGSHPSPFFDVEGSLLTN